MTDVPCPVCNQLDDRKLKGNSKVNWIICSHCDRPFHSSCVRINSLEFKELSQDWSLWYCPNCRNEGPYGDLQTKITDLQAQIGRLGQAPAANSTAVDQIIGPALDKILPNILNRIEATVITSLDSKINDCVRRIEGDFLQFKANIDGRMSELVDASVLKHIDTISSADANSNRRLECEIDRSVAIKVASALDDRINKLRIELSNELKPAPVVDPIANNAKLDAVSDKMERLSRASHLVLRNLPSEGEAGKADLRDVIYNIGAKANFTFVTGDIRTASRFSSTKHRICPVIVKFKSNDLRDAFFEHYFKNLSMFTLGALGLGDALSRVYFNEHLTERNMQLFNAASQLKRAPESRIKKVSTRNGLVYITAVGQTKGQLITSQDDLRCFSAEATNAPINTTAACKDVLVPVSSATAPSAQPVSDNIPQQSVVLTPINWSDNT